MYLADFNKEVNRDASGRTRTAEMTTLFDGKSLSGDETLLWENVGTGSGSFSNNIYTMGVGVGQYRIRRGKHTCPYFSGKSQLIETTFDNFESQAGVTKMVGYYTSSNVAPYNTLYDGFWLENDGTTVRIKIQRAGTMIADIPVSLWDNQSFATYDWANFTVAIWDFLWLGGTELRLFIKTAKGFELAHTYIHASDIQGVFIQSPNKSVRYEIRSTTGLGQVNSICSQVATEGGFPEAGKPLVIFNQSEITTNTVGIIYALKGVKKVSSFKDIAITATRASISNTGTADIGVGFLLVNPTLSAPLTYANNSRISEGTATTQTITNVGRVIASFPSGSAGSVSGANDSILSSIDMDIEDVSGEIVLAYMPTTSNQKVFGTLTVKEY